MTGERSFWFFKNDCRVKNSIAINYTGGYLTEKNEKKRCNLFCVYKMHLVKVSGVRAENGPF